MGPEYLCLILFIVMIIFFNLILSFNDPNIGKILNFDIFNINIK
jgi:hypothetical protein